VFRNRDKPTAARREAVVIGGNLGGLLTARVLADHFDRVTVVERDRYPDGPHPRKGVPQARHLHALLLRGQEIVEGLLPGLCDELRAAGAVLMDTAEDIAWLTPRGWGLRYRSELGALSCSRDLIDWCVRRRVAAWPRVRVVEETEVLGLLPGPGDSVGGVVVRRRGGEGVNAAGPIHGELVVDAGGRHSRAPDWLDTLGYPRPEETVINAFLGYASRFCARPPGPRSGWKGTIVQSAPPERRRGAIIFPVEGDRWWVTLIGGGGDYPPTEDAGFLEFARSLPTPMVYDALRTGEPITPIVGYRATENRLRHYERLPRRPEGFVVLGDAACAFNPVYGQGMTTAALGVSELGRCLAGQRRRRSDGDLTGLAGRFQRRLAAINEAPWLLATSQDLRYREVVGARPGRKTRFMHRYIDHVMRLATRHAGVRQRFLEVNHMLRKPSALFHPAVLLRVAWQAVAGRNEPGPRVNHKPMHSRTRNPSPIGGGNRF
jgi:2-polyprenyl-6-methoxyphenol hydroxylase-like FAD-dependent oxidoreductase